MIAVLSRDEDAVVDRDAPHSMQAMLDASANSPLSCSLSLSLFRPCVLSAHVESRRKRVQICKAQEGRQGQSRREHYTGRMADNNNSGSIAATAGAIKTRSGAVGAAWTRDHFDRMGGEEQRVTSTSSKVTIIGRLGHTRQGSINSNGTGRVLQICCDQPGRFRRRPRRRQQHREQQRPNV